jgi:hypothetical protein
VIKLGRYKHYKGGIYVVLFTAQHSDDGKPYVVYMNEKHGTYYIRPLKEFTANVNTDSEDGGFPRFQLLEEK